MQVLLAPRVLSAYHTHLQRHTGVFEYIMTPCHATHPYLTIPVTEYVTILTTLTITCHTYSRSSSMSRSSSHTRRSTLRTPTWTWARRTATLTLTLTLNPKP